MNMIKWAQEIIGSPRRLAIPIMTHPGIDMIGKQVVDAVRDGEIHARAVVALSSEYPCAASTVIMDLTVEAEAFGAPIQFGQNEVPSVVGRLVGCYADVENLSIPDLNTARIPEFLKANRITARMITDKPVFGGCIGPFSLAGRLFDMTEIMMAIYIEPETANLLLRKCTDFIITYIRAIKETGVQGIILAEPAAGLLSNDDALMFSTAYIREITQELQDENFMIVMHNCGNTGHCTDSMVRTGAKALHFGNKIDIVDALNHTPSDILVMGNLDPVAVFKQSSPAQVAHATREILDRTKPFKNFIVSSGCDTPPEVPQENILSFYSAVESFNTP